MRGKRQVEQPIMELPEWNIEHLITLIQNEHHRALAAKSMSARNRAEYNLRELARWFRSVMSYQE